MDVTPKTEKTLMRRMVEAGQESVWAEVTATIYSRGVSRILSAWGINPNEFLLNSLTFEQSDDGSGEANSKWMILSQPAYHGSPYRNIDSFSLDKVGTGEGYQTYGWGLYFADKKEVADHYRSFLAMRHKPDIILPTGEKISPDDPSLHERIDRMLDDFDIVERFDVDIPERILLYNAIHDYRTLDAAENRLDHLSEKAESSGARDIAGRYATVGNILRELRRKGLRDDPNPGQVYQVDIPEDDVLLDWDKPFSEQPKKVKNMLRRGEGENLTLILSNLTEDVPDGQPTEYTENPTGEVLYEQVSYDRDSPKAASEYLNSLGIKGIRYQDGFSRDLGKGSHNYVIFDDYAIEVLATYYQGPAMASDARGRTEFLDDGGVNVIFGQAADASTAIHEAAHLFRELMRRAVESPPETIIDQMAFNGLRADWRTVENWLAWLNDDADLKHEYERWGLDKHFSGRDFEALNPQEKSQARDVAKHEHFARGFETYLMEGRAPVASLRGLFQRVKNWLSNIYADLKELGAPLSPEVRDVFDRLLATDHELRAERQVGASMNIKDLKKAGRRAKVDPNQRVFDFDFVAALLEEREAEIQQEDNDEQSSIQSRPGSASLDHTPGQQMPHGQLPGDGDSGALGHEPAGGTAGTGTKPVLFDDTSPGTAGFGSGDSRPAGESGTLEAGADQSRNSGDARSEHEPDHVEPAAAPAPAAYVITKDDRLGEGGAKAKFRDNINALKTLQRLRETGASAASPEDQRVLVRYVGWGGLAQVFDPENTAWKKEAAELRGLLTFEEYGQARRSTQDAHYTSQAVIQGIYQGLERLGFQGPANILEPSVGVGHFLGLMPEHLRLSHNNVVAVELDSLSSSIAQYLYPNVRHINRSFQNVKLPDTDCDLVIGNPPFGSQKVYDPHYPDLDFSIHNFFLSKSVNALRDGGVAAFVVSRYFLDAVNNPAREYIAERANFLGAIRLPNTAFQQNALTSVTTDIVFFQRSSEPERDPAWLKTGTVLDPDGEEISVNQYFVKNPGQMIGRMVKAENMFRGSADLLPPENFAGFTAEIAERLAALPENIYSPRTDLVIQDFSSKKDPNLELCAGLKIGAYFMTELGELARRGIGAYDTPRYELFTPKNKRAGERIAGMIRIRDKLTRLMAAEQRDDVHPAELAGLRNDLNRRYDSFVQRYGYLNSAGNRQAFRDDPEWPLLTSLERDYDPGISPEIAAKSGQVARPPFASKADIFRQRVLGPRPKITRVDTPKEALIVSMNEFGRPDLEFMENLCGRPADEIAGDLAGLIYHNPENRRWEVADHYLTGNVKAKLAQAELAAQKDFHFKANVEALKMVQPPDLEAVDISVQLGSTWVPPEVVAAFARHLLGEEAVRGVGYHPALAGWATDFNTLQIDRTAAENTWGTSRYPAHKLIDSILNNTLIQVRDEVGRDPQSNRPIYKVNEEETAAASQKADEIRQAFLDWIWLDQERRENLARLYNDRFNSNVPRKYDGSHLTLPGSSLYINLRPHQKDAIWRGIQDGTALWDHVVGAGKTLCVVGTIMESRRMGLMQKPMVVVPNHLLAQWRDAFYSLYPQANILVADKTDFTRENREKLFAKIAANDWDAVVVAHSSFKRIGLPEETLEAVLNEQIDDLVKAIEEEKKADGRRFMVKELEKARDRLEALMDKHADTGKKDDALTFADLGCDALIVDESQEFKNLFINTRFRNVAGLGDLTGSAKAFDLFVKARYLQQKHNGRGLYFATGTPISNTIAEMYTIQRYMSYDVLKEKGLVSFDAWASTFGQVVTGWELDATGVGYKINSRFAKFQNMPELVNMYRTFADVITNKDLAEQNQGTSFTPKVKDGKPFNLVLDRSVEQAEYMGVQRQVLDEEGNPVLYPDGDPVLEWPRGSIIHRMMNLPKDPKLDNPLKITNDARKAGLDFRLINSAAPDHEGSKVNVAADNIFKTWKAWAADRGTQLVFCDLSTPKVAKSAALPITRLAAQDVEPIEEQEDGAAVSMDEILAGAAKFSVYDDLKAKLIAKGIPVREIRYIHEAATDAQKAKLFEEVNRGTVRVLMGSTAKMGAGTNVQRRLVALHHLDCPWRPADLEQREGRIIRQGNMFHERDPENFAVEITRYATKQTYDARQWQCVQGKAEGIEQFRKGDNLARVIEDVAGEAANAAEMKAAATGNELIFLQVKLAAELKKLEGVFAAFQRGQHTLERRISSLEQFPEQVDKDIERWQQEIELRNKNTTKEPYFAADGKIYGENNRRELLFEVARAMKTAVAKPDQPQKVGKYRGFNIHVESIGKGCQFVLEGQTGFYTPLNLAYQANTEFNIQGFIQKLDNYMGRFESNITELQRERERKAAELLSARQSQGQPFPQTDLLNALRQDNREVMRELQLIQKDASYKSAWKPASLDMADKPAKAAAQDSGLSNPQPAEPAVMYIQVGDRGSFPIFNDRFL